MTKVALVTGGTRGIGAAISIALQQAGYKVAATYVGNNDSAGSFRERTGIPVYRWDIRDYQACKEGVALVKDDLGPIDALVNNAGIARDGMFHKITPEDWNAVINTNLSGLFNMTHPVWPGMRERNFGRVINISSINGQKGQLGQTNYQPRKPAISASRRRWHRKVLQRGSPSTLFAPVISEPRWFVPCRKRC